MKNAKKGRSKQNEQKVAVIVGAGPAGLTAGYELLKQTNVKPIIFEMTDDIGGISKTVYYKGNRIDIGGHRFFSKSDVVMDWWKSHFPVQNTADEHLELGYQNKQKYILNESAADPDKTDEILLVRDRVSRIYYLRKLFSYPITLSFDTVSKLGVIRTVKIIASYFRSKLFFKKEESNLEEFFIKRFGRQLYQTFFEEYTEKVWGIHPKEISPEWGSQRIKGISITKVLTTALKNTFKFKSSDIKQKNVETSFIQRFLYPKFGPGQLWEKVAKDILSNGGEVNMQCEVVDLSVEDNNVTTITYKSPEGENIINADYVISTMPVKDLIGSIDGPVPKNVKEVASKLQYRDFITVGLLVKKLKIGAEDKRENHNSLIPDNWIYIQEPGVKVGRVQIFNNWSPYLVKDRSKVWIGLEFFCTEGDDFWNLADEAINKLAIKEVLEIDIIDENAVLDSTVIRMEKTYPAYFGVYDRFDEIRSYTDRIENLFLIGRNGMHRYNNQDHSMLTAMEAVKCIKNNSKEKKSIWDVNVDQKYHEEKS